MASPEDREHFRMLTKLFGMYAPRADVKVSIAGYMEELRDIPSLILSHGLKRLVQVPREFVPDVGTIRKECALFLRERHRIASGQDPNAPFLAGEINVERWLLKAREPLPALPAGREQEEFATPEQRAAGARLLDQLVARKGRAL